MKNTPLIMKAAMTAAHTAVRKPKIRPPSSPLPPKLRRHAVRTNQPASPTYSSMKTSSAATASQAWRR